MTQTRFGPTRAAQLSSMGAIMRHGGNISLGTDWPTAGYYSTFRPLDAIEIATTRRELDKQAQVPLEPAAERITLDEAIRANALGAAYQLGLDKKAGSIEVGKRADPVVLDKNHFEVPAHEIHRTDIMMTVMNGRVLWERLG